MHELEQHRQPGRRNAERLGAGTSCPRVLQVAATAPQRRFGGAPDRRGRIGPRDLGKRPSQSARAQPGEDRDRGLPNRRHRRPRARRECRLTPSGATAGPAPRSPRGARADRARTGSRRPRGWPLRRHLRHRRDGVGTPRADRRRLPPARRSPARAAGVRPLPIVCSAAIAARATSGRPSAAAVQRSSSTAGSLPQRASASAAAVARVRRRAHRRAWRSGSSTDAARSPRRAHAPRHSPPPHRPTRSAGRRTVGDTLAADGADRVDRGDADVLHPVVSCERVEQRHGEGDRPGVRGSPPRNTGPMHRDRSRRGGATRAPRGRRRSPAPARPPRAPAACPARARR